jgi:hypothetical protein
VWIIDIREERNPVIVSTCPVPQGDFCSRGLRFGPHNVHENRPGSFQSENLIFVTYYNAGLRVFDIRNQYRPGRGWLLYSASARRTKGADVQRSLRRYRRVDLRHGSNQGRIVCAGVHGPKII